MQAAETVVQVQSKQGAECRPQDIEGGDVGLAVGQPGRIISPVGRDQIEVGLKGVQFDAGTVATFVIACSTANTSQLAM